MCSAALHDFRRWSFWRLIRSLTSKPRPDCKHAPRSLLRFTEPLAIANGYFLPTHYRQTQVLVFVCVLGQIVNKLMSLCSPCPPAQARPYNPGSNLRGILFRNSPDRFIVPVSGASTGPQESRLSAPDTNVLRNVGIYYSNSSLNFGAAS